MSKITPAFITKQPHYTDIHNSFGLMGNEAFVSEYKVEDGGCGCSRIYHTTLTDTRLLIRSEPIGCCHCCQPDHMDVSVFLRDVVEILEFVETRHCCSSCCDTLCSCCGTNDLIEIRGTFGSQILRIPREEVKNLLIDIPTAIANHKLFVRH